MTKALRQILFEQVPKSEINPEDRVLTEAELSKLDSMARVHCNNSEMAHALGFNTMQGWFQFLSLNERIANRINQLRADGAIAIRTAQFKKALEGDTAMLAWLGRMVLKQNENVLMREDNGSPHSMEPIPLSDISPEVRKRLSDMAKSIYEPKIVEGEVLTDVNQGESEMSSDTPDNTLSPSSTRGTWEGEKVERK